MSLYAGVRNLQYECRSYRDNRVISKNQNKMAVTYYNIDIHSLWVAYLPQILVHLCNIRLWNIEVRMHTCLLTWQGTDNALFITVIIMLLKAIIFCHLKQWQVSEFYARSMKWVHADIYQYHYHIKSKIDFFIKFLGIENSHCQNLCYTHTYGKMVNFGM